MKKLTIQNLTINVNNEKINIITLENKTDKYILYSLVNNDIINDTIFQKMEFKENLQITPKKKFNDLKFSVQSKENNLFTLLINNKPIYYLKNNKNINITDKNLKLILSNGSIYLNNTDVPVKRVLNIDSIVKNTNLVDDILKKDSKIITFSNEVSNVIVQKSDTSKETNDVVNIKVVDKILDDETSDEESSNEEYNESNVPLKAPSNVQVNSTSNIQLDTPSDIQLDTPSDIQLDTPSDVVVDTPSDVVVDTPSDVVVDTPSDVVVDTPSDVIVDTSSDVIVDTPSDVIVDSSSNVPVNIMNEEIVLKNDTHKNSEELEIKKNKLDNDVFNLENILKDFNKLFSFVEKPDEIKQVPEYPKNPIVKEEKNIIEESPKKPIIQEEKKIVEQPLKKPIVQEEKKIVEQPKKNILSNEININQEIQNMYISKIVFQNIVYKINTLKLKASDELNFMNLYKSKVLKENIINKNNIAFQLEEHNSSYLILNMNQKYLINKINNIVIVTNLFNKTSQTVKNKDNFKMGNSDFMLYNNSLLIIPMSNKKIFDNNYGTSYNVYLPRL